MSLIHPIYIDDLTEALSSELKVGTILSYAAIRRGIQKLRDKYAEEGYFLSEVSYEVLPLKENQVNVKFTIKEHDPVSVRRVTFIGNDHVPDAEIRVRGPMILRGYRFDPKATAAAEARVFRCLKRSSASTWRADLGRKSSR